MLNLQDTPTSIPYPPAMNRHPPAWLRLTLGLGAALLALALLPSSWPWEARALVGWLVFCAVNLGVLWSAMLWADSEGTRQLATREDDSRAVAAFLTTAAALISLVGVGYTLYASGQAKPPLNVALTGLTVLTVALSWALVHTEYTLHYARRFYTDGGGVSFPDGQDILDDPNYLDFAYLSLTVAMTFQVSDTNITSRSMRRLLMRHVLLSYFFATVIIAVTINAVAGLVG